MGDETPVTSLVLPVILRPILMKVFFLFIILKLLYKQDFKYEITFFCIFILKNI